MTEVYGYNFTLRNSGGLGAILHDVMNAQIYAIHNNLTLCFIEEGYNIPRLNGSISDTDIPDKVWHSYFNSFPIVKQNECKGEWPKYLPNTAAPSDWSMDKYASVIQSICDFVPDVEKEINEMVAKTPFDSTTDIVLHIRMTVEKLLEKNVFLPVDTYIRECEFALSKLTGQKNRIYICTDNQPLCYKIKEYFANKNIDVVWDTTEPLEPLQPIRWSGKLSKTLAQQETMMAFKNLIIMKRAKYLIGGRHSYFFRIGELLHYPLESVNIQDSDKFGIAPYSAVKYLVRPYYKRAYPLFINDSSITENALQRYKDIYDKEHIVTIPDFISQELLTELRSQLDTFKWWVYAIKCSNKAPEYFSDLLDPVIRTKQELAYADLSSRTFAYRFKRTLGGHYATCSCVECRLCDTVKSFPVTDMLSKIVGCRDMVANEIFLSNYGKDDFLNIHHDKDKGDIAVTFSLSYDWNPTYGGILHFVDSDKNIYKSISPTLGSINIFRVTPGTGIDHFVSSVTVDKNRYMISAWYKFI
jgi:hypothetical protein